MNLEIVSNQIHKNGFIAFDVYSDSDEIIFQTIPQEQPFVKYSESIEKFSFLIDLPPLIPGRYFMSVWLGSHYSHTLDWRMKVVSFDVIDSPIPGRVYPHQKNRGYFCPGSKILIQ